MLFKILKNFLNGNTDTEVACIYKNACNEKCSELEFRKFIWPKYIATSWSKSLSAKYMISSCKI